MSLLRKLVRSTRNSMQWMRGRVGGGLPSSQRRAILGALQAARRQGDPAESATLLRTWHSLFPARPPGLAYAPMALLDRARWRFRSWNAQGIATKGADILDLAAGHGENLLVAHEFGAKSATAFDFSAAKYRELSSHANPSALAIARYEEMNLNSAKLPEEQFDLVVCNNSFHLFERPAQLFD